MIGKSQRISVRFSFTILKQASSVEIRRALFERTTAALARANGLMAVSPRLLATTAAGHASELAREAVENGADLVLALGGDGTINEVINGVAGSTAHLGILPAGTANVLAMELGLGGRLERAMERLSHAVPRRIALGRIETPLAPARFFALMAGAGLDAKIVTQVNPGLKERFGKGAYWAAGASQIATRLEQFEVLVNGSAYNVGFALASRVRNYGGDMEIASDASLLKPEFEVVLFEGSHPLRYVAYMAAVGLKQVRKMPGVHSIRATSLDIRTCAHLQIDGEYIGRTCAKIEIVPDALTLLLLPTYG